MKRLTYAAAAVLLVLGLAAIPAQSQSYGFVPLLNPDPVSGTIGAINGDVALLIRYIGINAGGGEVTVAAGGAITLSEATVATDTVECPISGVAAGIIDVTNGDCNTLGEVVDVINTEGSAFRAVILDGLRTDSSNNTLLAAGIATADSKDGYKVYWDTNVTNFNLSIALTPYRTIDHYLTAASGPKTDTAAVGAVWGFITNGEKLIDNVYSGTRTVLYRANETVTYTGVGTGLEIHSVETRNKNGYLGSETVTTYTDLLGASTVATEYDYPYGIYGKKDAKLLIRVNCATNLSAGVFRAYGLFGNYQH